MYIQSHETDAPKMATGGETNYSCCSSCLDDGRNTVARHYCVDCEIYFCAKCVKCHNIIPSLRKHQVNDVNSSDLTDTDDDTTSLQRDVPSNSGRRLRCTLHQGKIIDTHCKTHNEVCCGSCAIVQHRSCTTVSIAIAAKDFKASPDMNKFRESLTKNLAHCKQVKEKRAGNRDNIEKQKLELIENADGYEAKIIAKIKELANISRIEIRARYEEHKTVLDTDIAALEVVIATNADYIDKLIQTDDEQVFVLIKTNKIVANYGDMLRQSMTKDWKEKGFQFYFDQTLEKHVFEMKSLGHLDNLVDTEYQDECVVTEYQAKFHSKIDVKQSGGAISNILDLCLMDNNDLLLTDAENNKLKRFDSNLQFKDEIAISGRPVAVCKTDIKEVAVRSQNTNIVQFVSVGQSLQLTSSFKLANYGFGIAYDASTGEIYACEESTVNVYSKTGNKLRTFDKDTNGQQMFSGSRHVALSCSRQAIYVTDYIHGLFILDKTGTLKLKVSKPDAHPLCILPGHILLTGSNTSGEIVQLDKDGKQVGNLIDTKDGRHYTFCAVYDREHSRLIVGGYPSVLSVYTLSAK